MRFSYSKKFTKQYTKKSIDIKNKFIERQTLLATDFFSPILNNHKLSGEYAGCRSINITGDFRAVYEELGNDHFEFVAIGTHSELFS